MNDRSALWNLIQRYTDEIATDSELRQLEETLQNDADARTLFRHYLALDASLSAVADAAAWCRSEANTGIVHAIEQQSASYRTVSNQTSTLAKSIALCGVVICLLMMVVALWPLQHRTTHVWATVTEAGPGVNILLNGKLRPASSGDRVHSHEQIVVSDDDAARVSVEGLGIVALGPDTCLRSGHEPRLVELQSGFASVAAEKQKSGQSWRIRTPQAEAAVVGTEFNIASAKGRTALRVSEGVVHLTSLIGGQSERVRGGNRAIVVEGADPDIATCRPGSVLLLTSREPLSNNWDQFNQLLTEKLVNSRMWRLGFHVDVRHYEDVQPGDLRGRSLVIVSLFGYDIGEPALERIGLAAADVPVICLEPAAYPTLGMSAAQDAGGFGFEAGESLVEFVDSSHPLSAGYSGDHADLIRGVIGWGRPAGNDHRIAVLPGNPDQAVVFGYDAGRPMATFPAPARRVGLFLDPTEISEQATTAWNVFEAAVDWAVAVEVAI